MNQITDIATEELFRKRMNNARAKILASPVFGKMLSIARRELTKRTWVSCFSGVACEKCALSGVGVCDSPKTRYLRYKVFLELEGPGEQEDL